MRILYLSRGVDLPARLLMERLAARGDISAELHCADSAAREAMQAVLPCRPFRTRAKLDVRAILRLRRILAAGRYEIVHCYSSRLLANAVMATSGMARPPRLVGFIGFVRQFRRWDPVHRMTYLHPRVSAVCCNCDAVRDAVAASGVPRDKLHTVYFGLPLEDVPPPPDLTIREELGLPADATVVGFAGNMRPVKGVDVLLQAAAELAQENVPQPHWLLLGRVEDARVSRLAAHPAIRDRVHFTGFRDDGLRLMRAMNAFVMPSRSEGFSRAILEAMSLGLCPVVSSVGGSPEMVRDGVDGLVVPPDDVSALAGALRTLLRDGDLATGYGAAARERVRTAFTVEQMVEGTLAMYREVLNGESDGQAHANHQPAA